MQVIRILVVALYVAVALLIISTISLARTVNSQDDQIKALARPAASASASPAASPTPTPTPTVEPTQAQSLSRACGARLQKLARLNHPVHATDIYGACGQDDPDAVARAIDLSGIDYRG